MPWLKEDRSFKTLINKRTTSSIKQFYEEFGDNTINTSIGEVWIQSLPETASQAVSSGIAELRTLFVLTEDITVGVQQCYYAYDSGTGTRLKDWISDKYGSDYLVKLYQNDNTQIFPTDPCYWFFDYQTGILTFNGSTASFSKPFKITAYRYIGTKGITGLQRELSFTGGGGGLGSTGQQGVTGVRGSTGLPGLGVTGFQGATGLPGQGVTGLRGMTGVQGLGVTGVQGQTGLRGSTGFVGSTGVQGLGITGMMGVTGQRGLTGAQGITGVQGLGVTGFQGATGLNGLGVTGVRGLTGAQGLGLTGLQGTAGAQGPTGSQGFTGVQGLGVTGFQGATGLNGLGVTGVQGLTGAQGLGLTGLQGSQGVTGIRGLTGASIVGSTGSQGVTGVQGLGVTGLLGLTGAQGLGLTGLQGSQGSQGTTGVIGNPGSQGVTGLSGGAGSQGATGQSGATGIRGATGAQGVTGLSGGAGSQGATGLSGGAGSQGVTGLQGLAGSQGATGASGVTGLRGATGAQGVTGSQGSGATGVAGVTGVSGTGVTGLSGLTGSQGATGAGSGGSSTLFSFNNVSRYEVLGTSGEEVWVVSSSTVYQPLSWTRSTTTLTINRNTHGHSSGNRVIIRNTNVEYQVGVIATTSTNSFTVTVSDTGGTSGSEGAYSLGFTFAHNGSPKTGGTLSAPAGDHADVQLMTLRIRTGSRASTTYDLSVPASAVNGAGTDTALSNCFMPDFNVRSDADALAAVGATMGTNTSSSGYNYFRFGNLGALSAFIVLHF